MDNKVIIIQANLSRKRTADDELMEVARVENYIVAFIHEPYTFGSAVTGIKKYNNRVITEEVLWTAIVIFDSDYTATFLPHLSTSHRLCAHITAPLGTWYLISQYQQFGADRTAHMAQLHKLLREIETDKLIIGCD